MFKLFDLPRTASRGSVIHPRWRAARDGLIKNIARMRRYYQDNLVRIPSNHVLVSIINRYGPMLDKEPSEIYEYVTDTTFPTTNALGLTSSLSVGRAFNGVFFGLGFKEVLVASDEGFDYHDVYQNWQTADAVTVLYHPLTNLTVDLLHGINRTNETGLCVIQVNVPKLLMQYHAFRKAELIRVGGLDNQMSTMEFVSRFVLPGMFESQVDWALFNHYYRDAMGLPLTIDRVKHPIYVESWDKYVSEVAASTNELIVDKSLAVSDILAQLPMIGVKDAFELTRLPELLFMRANRWAMLVARLHPVLYLLKVGVGKGSNRGTNGQFVNAVQRSLIQLSNDNNMKNILDRFAQAQIRELVDVVASY